MFVDRVMGIDPGVSTTGYGVVERTERGVVAVDYGVVRTSPDAALPERLAALYGEIESLIANLQPGSMAIERILFQANAKTAISVGQASGAVLVAAARAGLDVEFYSPNEVKQAVAGYGAARKDQVTKMVAQILGLPELPRPADAADALGIAMTHINSVRLRAKLAEAGS